MLFLVAQALVGLLVLIQFNQLTIIVGAASLLLIAIYPFMKRVTWWPQLFLGLAFSWGALLGWSAEVAVDRTARRSLLYVGCILWVIGYDTIYALQDIEDDALIGVRSTARLFGRRVKMMVALFYIAALIFWGVAVSLVGAGPLVYAAMVVPAALLAWQVATLDAREPDNALVRFKSNHWVGLALTVTLLLEMFA